MQSCKLFFEYLIRYIVAKDLPGGKRSLAINMMAQHITFNEVIKPVRI